MANKCKECGCTCKQCLRKNSEIYLHTEIENLRQRLLERDNHIVTMETQFLNDTNKFPNGELASIREEILIWQDKYARLYEAHKRIQKVNQNLEDKLLRIVDKCETEKGAFIKDIATLSHRLADANYTIQRLKQDNDKYRNDVNLAIQLLQCKPSNFVGQKYDTLPLEVQAKVRSYVAQKSRSIEEPSTNDVKSITVPISSFPPTAMVYNVTKPLCEKASEQDDSSPPVEIVSAAIMARVLEDREKERIFGKHCSTCNCSKTIFKVDIDTQTNECRFNESSNPPNQNPIVIGYIDENDPTSTLRCNGQYHLKFQNSDIKIKSTELKRNNRNGETGNKNVAMKILNKGPKVDQNWSKLNGKEIKELRNSKDECEGEEDAVYRVRQEDIVNERLHKNSWKKYPQEVEKKKENNEVEKIDAINDRVWRSRYPADKLKATHVTVIEVASTDELASQNRQAETTTSPSFSSDSVVISSSDPSSLSSDTKSATNHENHRTDKSSSRNCLVRVKPGSKNILLDSIGTYETVLYTSGSERPNTILVHSKSRLDRSNSTSSEDNVSDVASREPSQLQRVAEWVESSNGIKVDERKERKSFRKPQKVLPIFSESKSKKNNVEELGKIKEKDLITFEEEDNRDNKDSKNNSGNKGSDYEVKVTKEMEETYLKLTASLDPAALKLDDTERLGITIEKYRQDHKKILQKLKSHCS